MSNVHYIYTYYYLCQDQMNKYGEQNSCGESITDNFSQKGNLAARKILKIINKNYQNLRQQFSVG